MAFGEIDRNCKTLGNICLPFLRVIPAIKIMNLRVELREKFSQRGKTSKLGRSREFARTSLTPFVYSTREIVFFVFEFPSFSFLFQQNSSFINLCKDTVTSKRSDCLSCRIFLNGSRAVSHLHCIINRRSTWDRSNKNRVYRCISKLSEMSSRFSTILFYSIAVDLLPTSSHEHIFSNYRQPSHATNCARVPPCRSPTSLIACEIILKNSIAPGGTGWSPTYYFAAADYEGPVKFLRGGRRDVSVSRAERRVKIQLLRIYIWLLRWYIRHSKYVNLLRSFD